MIADGAALGLALHGVADDPRAYLARFGFDAPPLDLVSDARPIEVEVNHGIWIWRCPCTAGRRPDDVSRERGHDDAPPFGGGVAFVDDPLGYCPACENAEPDGAWRRLRFPDDREQLEALLMLRPDPETRNWWPGETVDDLRVQNAEHGVGEVE